MIEIMKSKLHCVTVTEANLNYMGSITIDEDLMDAANLIAGEKVQVLDNNNGERFETYIIKGQPVGYRWEMLLSLSPMPTWTSRKPRPLNLPSSSPRKEIGYKIRKPLNIERLFLYLSVDLIIQQRPVRRLP